MMNWFNGTISEAIVMAKSRQAIFVVYVEGTDESSHLMGEILNSDEISTNLTGGKFVSIKLPANEIGYKQFAEIYKLVPIPSVFFIGNNGVPIDIVAADQSKSNLLNKIKGALIKCNVVVKVENAELSASTSGSAMASPANNSVSPGKPDVDSTKGQNVDADAESAPRSEGGNSLEERVGKVKKILVQKKEEKENKEVEDEKEREANRRKVGQELQKARLLQQDREMKELLAEREREKREEAEAKQRVLEQIAQDRAERARRQAASSSELSPPGDSGPTTSNPNTASPPTTAPTRPPQSNGSVARIQFKMPTGETKTHSFTSETTLRQIREFIDNNIVLSFSEYRLATTFPRREFTVSDDESDLTSLNLLPTAVILILPVTGSELRPYTRSWVGVTVDLVRALVQPLFSLTSYVQGLIFGAGPRQGTTTATATSPSSSQASSTNTAPPPPASLQQSLPQSVRSPTYIKKTGNIHSLRDHRDENDENNTWNGNSTQQM